MNALARERLRNTLAPAVAAQIAVAIRSELSEDPDSEDIVKVVKPVLMALLTNYDQIVVEDPQRNSDNMLLDPVDENEIDKICGGKDLAQT